MDESYDALRNIDHNLFNDENFVDHAKSSFDPVMVDKVINYHKLVGKL